MKYFKRHLLSKHAISRYCGQLKLLLASGIPLVSALEIASQSFPAKYNLKIVLEKVAEGFSFSEAMCSVFPPQVCGVVAGAERAGNLEAALGQLAVYYEQQAGVEEKVKTALVYPVFVVVLSLCAIGILSFMVLPGFEAMFADLGGGVPTPTVVIIAFFKILPLLLLVAVIAGMVFWRRMDDGFLLRFNFYRNSQLINAFGMLGSLLQGGVPLLEAMGMVESTTANRRFKQIVSVVKMGVTQGEKMSASLASHPVFPGQVVQMVMVGENAGQLPEILLGIAEFYEKEREVMIKRFVSLLEPALTLIVGLVVGVVVLAMFLPMLNMISRLQ
ncbi:MAG: type II secretion system F family protein [Candidatus Margulisiibacteriota bacterium]